MLFGQLSIKRRNTRSYVADSLLSSVFAGIFTDAKSSNEVHSPNWIGCNCVKWLKREKGDVISIWNVDCWFNWQLRRWEQMSIAVYLLLVMVTWSRMEMHKKA